MSENPASANHLSVLLLGGTSEGRRLASLLAAEAGVRVITSLAGRVSDPILPAGEVRIGGFGGPAGLVDWLRANRIDALVDATHPFAIGITASAAQASRDSGVALLRLQRPGWLAGPDDHWIRVPSLPAAASALDAPVATSALDAPVATSALDAPAVASALEGRERVFLTTGRQGLGTFAPLHRHWFLVRSVNPPDPPLPRRMLALTDRGPFTVDGELALMRDHAVEVVVTKDSGGEMAAAKLSAARQLGLPVVMVDRPPQPDVTTVDTVGEVVDWVRGLLR
jgi:precorrin-6A/cobalt-precorrin-6A reductase